MKIARALFLFATGSVGLCATLFASITPVTKMVAQVQPFVRLADDNTNDGTELQDPEQQEQQAEQQQCQQQGCG